MKSATKIVLVALAAGVLGVVASVWTSGPGPLVRPALRSELGQRALQAMASASAPEPPAGLAIAKRGQSMPNLVLPTPDGDAIALPAAYAGRPLLINLWASWCGPCIKEMPELDRFARQQTANGTQVVGIALDEADAVQAFLKRTPVSYPILLDVAGPADSGVRLGNLKGVLPFSVLVGADGRVLKQKLGPFETGEIREWVGKH
ncbi:MAG: TlpA family protein disulfide reductase [Lysobacter sp.]